MTCTQTAKKSTDENENQNVALWKFMLLLLIFVFKKVSQWLNIPAKGKKISRKTKNIVNLNFPFSTHKLFLSYILSVYKTF